MDSGSRRARVIVVQGQAIISKALCHLLAQDQRLEVVGDARTIQEAHLRATRPDLLLIDLDGFESEFDSVVTACRTASPSTRIMVLTSHAGPHTLRRCLACGVDAYVTKDVSPDELMRACHAVLGGETYFDPRVAGGFLRRLSAPRPPEDELSLREGEIIRLIASGLSNKEIGDRLDLAEKTVKNHISRIFVKLQVRARTEAAIYAIRNGIA